jgi:hypothetical protein
MIYFQTKNPNSGKFWRALDYKLLIYFIAIWYILWTFGMFYVHLVHLCQSGTVIWFGYPVPRKNLATLARSRSAKVHTSVTLNTFVTIL